MAVRPAGRLCNIPLTPLSKNRNTICRPFYQPRNVPMPLVLVGLEPRSLIRSLFQLQILRGSSRTMKTYTHQIAGKTLQRIYVRPHASRNLFGTASQADLRITSTSATRSGWIRITKKQEAKVPVPRVLSPPLEPAHLLGAQRQREKSPTLFNPWPSQRTSLSW